MANEYEEGQKWLDKLDSEGQRGPIKKEMISVADIVAKNELERERQRETNYGKAITVADIVAMKKAKES